MDAVKESRIGNAGYIGTSHHTPLANPQRVKSTLKWMLSPTSPFYIRPSLDKGLIDWGLKFMASATSKHVRNSTQPLIDIARLSQNLYEEWCAEFSPFSYERKGLIEVYQTEKAFQSAVSHARTATATGLPMEPLNRSELHQLEPHVDFNVIGGIHVLTDTHVYPSGLMNSLLQETLKMGVQIIESEPLSFTTYQGKIVELRTREQSLEADLFILAAGAWSRDLSSSMSLKIPMIAGRGYSITYPLAVCPLAHPVYLGEASVAFTPMNGDKVRVGGTMEIVAKNTPPQMSRVRGILNSARRFLPHCHFPEPKLEDVWYGYRPCSADSLPYIGRSATWQNLVIATGHSMIGISLGPATGKLVAEVAEETTPTVNLTPFNPNRFHKTS